MNKHKVLRLLLFLFSGTLFHPASAQSVLMGMTSGGGQQFGTIMHYPAGTTGLSYVYPLEGIIGAYPRHTHWIQATNGKLYGMTSNGGASNKGVIFEYDFTTNLYTKKIDLNGASGCAPYGSLIEALNGKLYGMTYQGGTFDQGVIFEYDFSTNIYTKKIDLNAALGYNPYGSLLQASNGKLYGMTYRGGISNEGVIFEYDYNTNVYTKKIDLSVSLGRNPFGAMIQVPNGKLYGLTNSGGATNEGVIFEYDYATNTYIKKLDLSVSLGRSPYGSLLQATNGKLYGLTNSGGATNEGVIFEYDYNASTYTKKIDLGNALGSYPSGSLIQASNGKLYGTTYSGGAFDKGVIFEYNCDSNIYSKKIDLSYVLGSNPRGSLMQASNDKLYGMTYYGGVTDKGVIFEYDYANNAYTKIINFSDALGSNPRGSLMQASNGKLYGMNPIGGTSNGGVIFEYDPVTNTYTSKIDLDSTLGRNPYGSLIQASNGLLYGMTQLGGTTGEGVIFEYDYASNIYTKKIDLNGTLGRIPYGSLMQASNGKCYGMTCGGGATNNGVIFEYDIATNTYTKKIDLNDALGSNPYGSLIQASNGKLYGMTLGGGNSDEGVIFEYDYSTNTCTNVYDMSYTLGVYPVGSLMEASNGKLYGMTSSGGTSNLGVIFEYDYSTTTYTKKIDLSSTLGSSPRGSLMQASSGKLYGMTSWGGASDEGVIFEYDYATNTYVKMVDLTAAQTGASPLNGHLIEIDSTLGITPADDLMKAAVYPNPANSSVTIRFNTLHNGPTEIRVMDIAGRIMIHCEMNANRGTNSIELDLKACSPGLYLLQVSDADGNSSTTRLAVNPGPPAR